MNNKDHFAHKSKSWDMSSRRVKNARAIAKAIVANIKFDRSMKLMDFGAGTGLLSFFIAPYARKIVAVDNSPSMLEQFREKSEEFECDTEIIKRDLAQESLDMKFDGIISSMTLHHIEEVPALFLKFHDMLEQNGFVAIADLDTEDGSFHSEDTGVHHYGFDRVKLENIVKKAGFTNIHFETVSIIEKPERGFSVFLMTAVKR